MLIAGHRRAGTGLCTAQFAFGPGTEQDAVATVPAALDAGVRLIDTALAYTRPGFESYAEPVVARAPRPSATRRPRSTSPTATVPTSRPDRPACRGDGGRGVSRVRKAGRLVSRLALCR